MNLHSCFEEVITASSTTFLSRLWVGRCPGQVSIIRSSQSPGSKYSTSDDDDDDDRVLTRFLDVAIYADCKNESGAWNLSPYSLSACFIDSVPFWPL